MRKIQILFPDPLMRALREVAKHDDQPVSEIVRRATESWLAKRSYLGDVAKDAHLPSFHGGRIKMKAAGLRQAAYADKT